MLSTKLKILRKKANLTQKQVAFELGITESGYGFYEQGKRKPDIETLKKIAIFYNVSIDFLLDMASSLKIENQTNTYTKIAEDLRKDIQVIFHDITTFDKEKLEKLKFAIQIIKCDKKKKTP